MFVLNTHSPARHTVSKAFLKSTNPQYSFFFDSSVKSVRHFKLKTCSAVEELFLNPACTSDSNSFCSKNLYNLLLSNSCKTRRNTAKDEQKY